MAVLKEVMVVLKEVRAVLKGDRVVLKVDMEVNLVPTGKECLDNKEEPVDKVVLKEVKVVLRVELKVVMVQLVHILICMLTFTTTKTNTAPETPINTKDLTTTSILTTMLVPVLDTLPVNLRCPTLQKAVLAVVLPVVIRVGTEITKE